MKLTVNGIPGKWWIYDKDNDYHYLDNTCKYIEIKCSTPDEQMKKFYFKTRKLARDAKNNYLDSLNTNKPTDVKISELKAGEKFEIIDDGCGYNSCGIVFTLMTANTIANKLYVYRDWPDGHVLFGSNVDMIVRVHK